MVNSTFVFQFKFSNNLSVSFSKSPTSPSREPLAAAAVNLVETKIGTQMKIKELKEKLEANTSEKLFGIDEQPEQNCPKVDKGIRAWY